MESPDLSSSLSSLKSAASASHAFSSPDRAMSTRLRSGAQKVYRAVSQTFSRTAPAAADSLYKVGSGADKTVSGVIVSRSAIPPPHEKDYVLYSASGAVRSILRVVKNEFDKIRLIRTDLEKATGSGKESFVATDWDIAKGSEKVKGKFTAKAERAAGGDLDRAMRGPLGGVKRTRSYDETGKLKIKLTQDSTVKPEAAKREEFTQRQAFGAQYLQGMANLHKAGWACGDPKPENALVYYEYGSEGQVVKQTVRISDFGKAERVTDEQGAEVPPRPYIGNPRFAPPEGTLSEKGDVYGAGIGLIRMWEEGVLAAEGGAKEHDETMMISTAAMKEADSLGGAVPKDKRRGLERFLIRNKHSLAADRELGSYGSWIKCRMELNKRASQGKDREITLQEKQQEAQISAYVEALGKRIEESGTPVDKEELGKLCQLFKRMTSADPGKRPTMEEALQAYQALKVFPEPTTATAEKPAEPTPATAEKSAETTTATTDKGPPKKIKPRLPPGPRPGTVTSTTSSSTSEASPTKPPPLPTTRPKPRGSSKPKST